MPANAVLKAFTTVSHAAAASSHLNESVLITMEGRPKTNDSCTGIGAREARYWRVRQDDRAAYIDAAYEKTAERIAAQGHATVEELQRRYGRMNG